MNDELMVLSENTRASFDRIMTPVRIKFTWGELSATLVALRNFAQGMLYHVDKDRSWLELNERHLARVADSAKVYSATTLYRRLNNQMITRKEEYSVTLNYSEVMTVQLSLSIYLSDYDNMTARIAFGKIHQKTI